MATLRFTSLAEAQLQAAYNNANRAMYSHIISTLASIENDAALFTLLEATPLGDPRWNAYGVRIVPRTQSYIDVVYVLSLADEDATIVSITWS